MAALVDGVDPELSSIHRVLFAMLALQIADRSDGPQRATEVILADAGLTLNEIATLTGRKYDTVKKAIQRARARPTTKGGNDRE